MKRVTDAETHFRRILILLFTIAAVLACSAYPHPAGAQRRIKVAAVQTVNRDFDYEGSMEAAERLIVQAAEEGAELILLPELALIGYTFENGIWDLAEPLEGPTVAWMRELCQEHDIYLATCILEVKGDDFFDTFVLVGPGEGELWAHRKIEPALFEARYFKGGGINPSVFDTPIGRVGALICWDSSKTASARELLKGDPDILLLTFSAPGLMRSFPEGLREENDEANLAIAPIYARILGVPVISCDKTGPFDSPLPLLPPARLRADFVAKSQIVDADGNVISRLGTEEAVIVEEVTIGDPAAEQDREPVPEGKWIQPYSFIYRGGSILIHDISKVYYDLSPARKKAVERAKK